MCECVVFLKSIEKVWRREFGDTADERVDDMVLGNERKSSGYLQLSEYQLLFSFLLTLKLLTFHTTLLYYMCKVVI